jgi:hypothetical protein
LQQLNNMKKINDTTFGEKVKDEPKDTIEVEVGDSKQPDFKPQVKVMRWDNEVNFSIRAEEKAEGIVEDDGTKIKYITDKYEVHQYHKPETGEDGGYEFEWVLKEKPDTNVLAATIQTKGLDFFYQPELTAEEIERGYYRPENIIGSYAAFHNTKSGNGNNGKDYRSGKAFHIYRPHAIDANGVQVWCELNIDTDSDLLTVTVPKEFLDTAAYPVVVDPTLGFTSIGGSNVTTWFGYIGWGSIGTAPSAGTVDSLSVYIDKNGGVGTYKTALYIVNGTNNGPGVKKYGEETGQVLTAGANWNTNTNFAAQTLANGTEYWIGFKTDVNFSKFHYDTGGKGLYEGGPTYAAAWPSPSTFTTTQVFKWSFYVTYTATGSVNNAFFGLMR